jgi:hypothetical protein
MKRLYIIFFYLSMLVLPGFFGCSKPVIGELLPEKGFDGMHNVVVFLGDSLTTGYGVSRSQAFPKQKLGVGD